ncbi:MAG TPA: hypothetical protein VLB44_01695 [Kofleriaceae bacterium]|nr:hypothetical protein [Kofleriaceae bacterium]
MGGPTLPILLLAIPVGMAAIVLLGGLLSLVRRPTSKIPRAVVVPQASRTDR